MKYLFTVLLVSSLLGCTNYYAEPQSASVPVIRHESTTGLNSRSLDYYTQRLATALFTDLVKNSTTPYTQLAISSFLPIRQLSLDGLNVQEIELADQLAESMLTEAVQRGYVAVDVRLRKELLLKADHEQAFSRQLTELRQQHRADALLSGTYTAQEDGFMVNVRLIDLHSQQVLAAATDYVPDNVMWSTEKMRKRGGYLYRSERTGERL